MSTNSNIALYNAKTKQFKSIYCHYDGYLSHHGDILLRCYNTKEKVEELLSKGGLLSLKEEVEDCTMFLEEELNVKTIELKDLHKENHYGFLYVFIVSDDFTGWKYNAEGEDFVVITNELIEESL